MNGGPIREHRTYWGEPWPDVDGWRQVPAPVQFPCRACKKQIDPDSQGIHVVVQDGPFTSWFPLHRACTEPTNFA